LLRKPNPLKKQRKSKRKKTLKPRLKKKLIDKHLFKSRPKRKLNWLPSRRKKISNKQK
jgi:hypothetical protein